MVSEQSEKKDKTREYYLGTDQKTNDHNTVVANVSFCGLSPLRP